ncbi:MAG: hypothetical protein COA78_24910 [Blastopirellula sp.]|nr:MAG: hypothetical protein COA78_24910 [Blastopirellula sp.]
MKWLPKLRFSMRTLFIIVTLLCVLLVPLSVKLYQARQQRLAVEWVLANGGSVHYDYQEDEYGYFHSSDPADNLWLRSVLGNDFFDEVVEVGFENLTVTDISQLTHLQSIETVVLVDPQNVDLSPLGSLKNLDSLDITFSSEKSYTAKNMEELSKLDCSLNILLHGQLIDDLTPVQQLNNIRELELIHTEVNDLSPLSDLMQLELLDIDGANVTDLTPLAKLINLRVLKLDTLEAKDLSPLSDLTQLEELHIVGSGFTDITPLAKLVKLRDLRLVGPPVAFSPNSLKGPNITDLMPLTKLVNLRELRLYDLKTKDLSPLENLVNLEELHIHGANITDLTPLAKLINLRDLWLEAPKANDLAALAKLVNLRELWLYDAKAKDLAPLENLVKIEYMQIVDGNVTDLTPLAKLINLRELSLETPKANDLGPLYQLSNLKELYLEYGGMPVPKEEIGKLKKALPNCYVKATSFD